MCWRINLVDLGLDLLVRWVERIIAKNQLLNVMLDIKFRILNLIKLRNKKKSLKHLYWFFFFLLWFVYKLKSFKIFFLRILNAIGKNRIFFQYRIPQKRQTKYNYREDFNFFFHHHVIIVLLFIIMLWISEMVCSFCFSSGIQLSSFLFTRQYEWTSIVYSVIKIELNSRSWINRRTSSWAKNTNKR